MPQPVETTMNMLLDIGPETLIGALILAVLIATLTTGAYSWLRRGKSEATTILVALILVANLACLVTGAGFIKSMSTPLQSSSTSRRMGTLAGGLENGQHGMPYHRVRSGPRWRRTSYPGRARAERTANSAAAPVSPE